MYKELAKKINNKDVTSEDLEQMHQRIIEHALKALPGAVDYLMKQSHTLKKTSEEFYEKNPRLTKHRQMVAQLVEQTEAKNPGRSYREILSEVETEAKRRLDDLELADKTAGRKLNVRDLDERLGNL